MEDKMLKLINDARNLSLHENISLLEAYNNLLKDIDLTTFKAEQLGALLIILKTEVSINKDKCSIKGNISSIIKAIFLLSGSVPPEVLKMGWDIVLIYYFKNGFKMVSKMVADEKSTRLQQIACAEENIDKISEQVKKLYTVASSYLNIDNNPKTDKEYIDKLFNAILLLYPLVPLEKREDCSMKYWQEKRIYEMLFNMDINLDDTNKDFDLYKKNIALFIKELERFLDELIEFATLPRSIIYESLGGRYRQNNAKS